MSKALPLETVFRNQVKALREKRGWNQDHLAAVMSASGPDWSDDTVRHFEEGSRRLSLSEFVLLCRALGGLKALLPPGTNLVVGGHGVEATLVHDWIRAGLSREERQQERDLTRQLRGEERARLAEAKAARALGVEIADVLRASRRLWQTTLTRRREQIFAQRRDAGPVSDRSSPAIRGHITRELMRELREEIARTRSPQKKGARG